MTTTTYHAMTADEQLAGLREPRPVLAENAVGIFSRTLLLPLRKPGATRPELLGARRVGAGRLG